jgi:predicted amidohydrolase YtcJ
MSTKADFLFINARAFTADFEHPSAEAVAVRGNRIVFVGSNAEAQAWKDSSTRVIDARGHTLMPGFIDSHFHMLYGALNMNGMQFEQFEDYEAISQKIRSYAAEHPNDTWLHGTGLGYNAGPGQTPLTRQHLDALAADRPIYLNSYDGHTSWANTLALKMAGLLNGGNCGANSEIVLDEHGEATGELREPGAFQPVSDLAPKPDSARKRVLLNQALKLTASLGVTSVHNMDGNAEQAAMYASMEDSGELTCRIYIPYSVSPETPFDALEKEALAMKKAYASEMVRAGSIKFFMDGVIEGYTGLLVEPYADNPATHGDANYETEHFKRMVTEADRLGLQIFTHSVGDLGVRRVLDAYEAAQQANGSHNARHRVEHIELVHPDDLTRFRELGVIASMQPLHAPSRVDDGDIWPSRVGLGRWHRSFAWQTLREAGATLAFGSDWPVVTQNPMRGVANALNRASWAEGLPNHRQKLADTLIAYTRDAAYAEFQERQKGQLKVGYLADIVLLSENIFEFPAAELGNVTPTITMMDGRIVHEAGI